MIYFCAGFSQSPEACGHCTQKARKQFKTKKCTYNILPDCDRM
jgi:hypothetical protein